MTKDEVMSIIAYIVMIVFAIVVGVTSIAPAVESGYIPSEGGAFLFLIIALIIGVIINGFLFEIGHVIGAKLGGYEIVSFNAVGFAIYKVKTENDTFKRKFGMFRSFDGLAGETVITPKKEKCNPIYYVLAPLVMFLIEIIGVALVFTYIENMNYSATGGGIMFLKYGYLVVVYVAAMMIIYNYWPHRLDSLNDGYRLMLLNKKINIEAYNEFLKVQSDNIYGIDHGEIKTFENITDFTARVNLMSAIKYASTDTEKANEIIEYILEHKDKISKATALEIKITKAIILFFDDKYDEAYAFYKEEFDEKDKKYVTSCNTMDAVRLYLLIEGLVEKSVSEVDRALQRAKKILKRLVASERDSQEKLLEEVKQKINVA